MIVYLVELDVEADLRGDYLAWLAAHVQEMLTLPGFVDAETATRIDPPASTGRFVVQVRYRLRDLAAWQAYVSEHAPRMREAGITRFGDRVRASRSLLETT